MPRELYSLASQISSYLGKELLGCSRELIIPMIPICYKCNEGKEGCRPCTASKLAIEDSGCVPFIQLADISSVL